MRGGHTICKAIQVSFGAHVCQTNSLHQDNLDEAYKSKDVIYYIKVFLYTKSISGDLTSSTSFFLGIRWSCTINPYSASPQLLFSQNIVACEITLYFNIILFTLECIYTVWVCLGEQNKNWSKCLKCCCCHIIAFTRRVIIFSCNKDSLYSKCQSCNNMKCFIISSLCSVDTR